MKTATIFRSILVSGIAALFSMGCVVDGTEEEPAYSITVSAEGHGTASSDVQKAIRGETVTVSAVPDPDYMFSHWVVVSGKATLSSETANPATFEMFASNVEVKAVFLPIPTYAVTVAVEGNGTAGADKAVYREGETVTLTAEASEGSAFLKWTVTGGGAAIVDVTANPATFVMPASAVEVTAEFYDLDYDVTVYNGGNGTAAADKAVYKKGETVTLTATADSGCAFLHWTAIDGGVTLADDKAATTTFVMPANAVSLMAEFVVLQPEANSYVCLPYSDEWLYIPVSQANRVLGADGMGASTAGLAEVTADNYTVELVWADRPADELGTIRSIKLDGKGYIEVQPTGSGNVVVGIKVGGKLRWSWHIWMTELGGGEATDSATGLTWMDRNLGAEGTAYDAGGKNGLFYQWGRKDAFPASDGTNNSQTYYTAASGATGITANPAAGSYTELPDMIQNPLVFATNISSYCGSLNVSGDANNSWGGASGGKTVYDPCPPGWKVPPVKVGSTNSWGSSSDWTAYANYGRRFNGAGGAAGLNHYYPAAGVRNVNSGALNSVGSGGYCWAADADSGSNGQMLYFTSMSVSPADVTDRGNGLPVRCVKE